MQNFLILVFISVVFSVHGQKFSHRSKYERHWALSHPFATLKVKEIYNQCLPFYETIKKNKTLDSLENGGKLDAFRHAFFMAAFSQKIKVRKIRKLGIAHEKGNYTDFLKGINEHGELPDSLSGVMDLYNNELGLKAGSNNKKKNLIELKNILTEEIKNGRALYFKRNNSGQYLTCKNEIIFLENYRGKWFIPKCLIPTNN